VAWLKPNKFFLKQIKRGPPGLSSAMRASVDRGSGAGSVRGGDRFSKKWASARYLGRPGRHGVLPQTGIAVVFTARLIYIFIINKGGQAIRALFRQLLRAAEGGRYFFPERPAASVFNTHRVRISL
jgi:hypothetical protein